MNHYLINRYLKPALQLVLLFVAATSWGTETRAQQPTTEISLFAAQYKLNRLAPRQTAGEAIFSIDRSSIVTIDIIANIGGLATSVLGPTGQVINENTVGGLGGSFTVIEGAPQQDSPLILPSISRGFHYIFIFPWLGTGNYTVRFQASANLAQEVAIITQVTTDSRIGVSLFVTETVLVLGNPAMLTAAIFDGQTPIAGASVRVVIQPESGPLVNLILRDDGGAGDNAAGDGLYTGEFIPTTPGKYTALALINGTTPGGILFTRQSATEFIVVTPNSKLTGALQDQGVDDNGDGLFDRVVIDVLTNTTRAGEYRAFVHLKTARGQNLVRSAAVNLSPGIQNVRIDFEATAFLQLGENGPYNVELIELVFIGNMGATPSDRLLDVGQTQTYHLSQFQRPAIVLTGITSDRGFDDNGNGRFDRLLVSVQVNVLRAGSYSWSFKLTDGSHRSLSEIDFASNSGFLTSGLNNILVEFDGKKIGAFGANGPYLLRDLLLFGPSTSLVAPAVGQTQPYLANQFEQREQRQADLSITKIATPNPVLTGSNITYTLTVTNNGPSAATSVTVADHLPASITFVSCSSTGGGVCGGSGNNRTVTFASLAAGASATITLVAGVNCSLANGAAINNMAKVSSSTPDPDTSNNSRAVTATASNPPPVITLAPVPVNPSILWPPNHKMVDVTVNYNTTDNCPLPTNACVLSVTSNEPINGTGDGDTAPDWEIVDAHHVRLRAERAGNGTGRIYTITITCTDSAGGSSRKTVTVSVPKSQGH